MTDKDDTLKWTQARTAAHRVHQNANGWMPDVLCSTGFGGVCLGVDAGRDKNVTMSMAGRAYLGCAQGRKSVAWVMGGEGGVRGAIW